MLTTSQRTASCTSFIYDHFTDTYISTDGTKYTYDEVDAIDRIEKEWEDNKPHLTFTQWVEMFADEKPAIADALRAKIKLFNEVLRSADVSLAKCKASIQKIYMDNPTDELYKESKAHIARAESFAAPCKEELKKEIAILRSHLNYVTGKKSAAGKVSDHDISRAKEYPITSLVKVGRDKKALCPFHSDTKPSLHVYKDNHAYCFVCAKRANAIDIYMVIHSCDFKTALKALTI